MTAGPWILLPAAMAMVLVCCVLPAWAVSWQGDFQIRVLSPRTDTIFFSGKIYQEDMKVRIEPAGAKEINLYDFERSLKFRLFPEDKIYFRTTLSLAEWMKAAKEGWSLPPAPHTLSKILLNRVQLEEKTARLYLMTLEMDGRRSYSLRWVSDDVSKHLLRSLYAGAANETVIVDYVPKPGETLPPDYFNPPADYLSLNPF